MAVKRASSLLLALVLMMSLFVLPAYAEEGPSNDDTGIQPRYEICGCGGAMINRYGSWGVWLNDHQEKCAHYHYGTVMIQIRYRTVTVKCQSCGQGYSYQQSETQRICHGYN